MATQAKRDPWEQFEDAAPIGESTAAAGLPAPPVDPPTVSAPSAPDTPAAPETSGSGFDQFSDAPEEAPLNTAGTYEDIAPPASQLPAEDEAQLLHILRTGTAAEARKFAASKGFGGKDNFDEVVAAREKGHGVNPNLQYQVQQMPDQNTTAGAFGRGFADIPTIGLLDELGAVVDTVGGTGGRENLFNSDRPFSQILNSNIDINRGIIQGDEAEHPVARITGQLLGGLVIPTGLEGVGLRAGASALREGASMQEARAVAAAAVRNRMVAVGGATGGAYGAGSAEGGLKERAAGAAVGAATGAATSAALGVAGEAIAPRIAARAVAARQAPESDAVTLGRAAERQGIDILPADVGGPVTRRATSMTAQTIAGGQPVITASQRMGDQVEARRNNLATAIGRALRPEAAGQVGIRGARAFIRRTSARARELYGAANAEAAGVRLDTPLAIQRLDEHIAELAETPGGSPGLDRLTALRDELLQGNFSPLGLRNMRTVLQDDFAENGLRGSDIERRVNDVVDATSADIMNGLRAAGRPEAARLYGVADRYWRARVNTIDNTLEAYIGTRANPKSGEQVVRTLTADLQGNNARAVNFLRSLAPEEQADVRASLIGSLGRARKGQQNAEGDGFSLQTFLTNWNEIGETAKRAYFGPEARAALNDLALVAQGAREAQQYANRSNTGGAVGNLLTIASGIGGVATFGKTIAAQYGLGRLLASPRFARWLARAPRTHLSGPAYIERLSRIARSEPAIANEALDLQRRLTAAFSSAPTRAAADEPLDEGGGIPGQDQ